MMGVIIAMLCILIVCVILGFKLVFSYDTSGRDAALIFTTIMVAIVAVYFITLMFAQEPQVLYDLQLPTI